MRLGLSIILLLTIEATIQHGRAQTICIQPLNGSSISIENRKNLILHLAANVTDSGFTTATVGRPPDQVYGLGMCLGNASPTDCRRCMSQSIEDLSYCNSSFSWWEECMWRYSPENFFGVVDTTTKAAFYVRQNVTESVRFREQKWTLLGNLTASTVSNETGFMFSKGEIGFNGSHKIDGLVQCTRDISKVGCGNCLADVRSFIADILDDWISLDAATGNCFMRCRLQATAPFPLPPSPPTLSPPPRSPPPRSPPAPSEAFSSLNWKGTLAGKLGRNLGMIIISTWASAGLLF